MTTKPHPVYSAALAKKRAGADAVWLDTCDVAKLIRSRLAVKIGEPVGAGDGVHVARRGAIGPANVYRAAHAVLVTANREFDAWESG